MITSSAQIISTPGYGAGSALPAAIPGIPGLNAIPVQSGLMAEYRMLSTETPSALVDYSGQGHNATGTVGTGPTIIAGSGGLLFGGAGAVSLPAALNSAHTIQIFFMPAGNGGAILAGNGAAANMILLIPTQIAGTSDSIITGYPTEHNLRLVAGRVDTAPITGAGPYPRFAVGTGAAVNIAWTLVGASADNIYINGVVTNSYILSGTGSGAGHQTNGNYQLGGLTSGSFTNWSAQLANYANSGTQIFYAVFYNRVLSAAEIQQNTVYINNQILARAGSLSPYKPVDVNSSTFVTVAVDGDSLSCGACANVTPLPAAPYTSYLFGLAPGNSGGTSVTNQALGGRTLNAHLVPAANQAIDPLFYPYSSGNLAIVWGGTNDGTQAAIQAGVTEYCADRHKIGWKCAVIGVLDGHGDAIKNTYNTWLRQNWTTFADIFIDLASDPVLGANGAQANTTDFYTTDNLHIQDNGIINHEAPYIKRAINRFYGNHDFSAANIYAAPALAAVATTAGVSTATQNVLTAVATPVNCVAGSWILVAGVTPVGYNGSFYLTSVTPTTMTMHNAPSKSSLGNITIQGTVVCPQQQDADQYQVLNFGTGNYTLQTAVGMTGQNIWLKNINGSSSTIVPYNGETIDGAANLAIASNGVVCLQSELVSSAAAGCNWITCK